MSFTAIITADAKGFERAIDQAQAKIDGLEKTVGRNLDSISEKFTDIGKKMTVVSAGIIAGLGASVKASIDFESAFAGVLKTVDGTTEQLDNLRQGIIDMSKEIPASTTEIAKVAEAAGQLGIETDRILEFTRTMIDLGESTNLSSEQASTALARFANITQMSQKDFDRLGSTIVALGNNFATTEAEITEMALRLAGAGKQVGLSESEILALSTALSSVGIEAEAGGSAFSRLLSSIQLAVETGNDDLRNFAAVAGMSAQQFANTFRENAVNALNLFIQGLSNTESNGMSAIAVLDKMGITEIRLRDAILRASSASDLFTEAVKLGNQAWEENTALTEEAGRRYQTTASQIAILKNNLADVGRVIGDILLPTINSMVARFKDILNAISSLNPVVLKIGVAFAGIVAAIGPAMLALGQLLKIAPLIGTAFTAMTGPVGIAVAAIAGAAALIVKNWDAIKEYFTTGGGSEMFSSVKALAVDLFENIKNTFNSIRDVAVAVWDQIGSTLTSIWSNTFDSIKSVLDFFMNTVKNVADFLRAIINGDFKGALNALLSQFSNIFVSIGRIVTNTISSMAGVLGKFLDVVGLDKWAESVNGFADRMANAFTKQKDAATEAATVIEEVSDREVTAVSAASEKVVSATTAVSDTFTKLIGTNLSLQDSIKKTSDTIDELQSRLIKLQTGIISSTNVRDEIKTTQQQINDLSEALNLLTGGRELNLKVNAEMPTIAADMNKFFDGKNWTLPAIDSSLLQTSLAKAGEMVIDYGRYIEGGIVDVVSAIGNAWGSGDWSNLGKDMLSAVGKLAQQFGAMVIGFAIAADALKKIITTNPIAAIAAGAALIALGAAAQAAAGKMMNNAFSGSSGGYDRSYSGGTSSYQQATPSYAPTEFRGPYQENYTVEFKIGTNELVGVLDMAEQKKRRL